MRNNRCCICGGKIYPFEKYVENYIGDRMHYDCHFELTSSELFKWLDIDVNYMDDYEEDIKDEFNDEN